MANKIRAPASPSYIDFEPKSELKEEENLNTLIIHLPGFKKEQLRVQVSNIGILKVIGEKPENNEGTSRSRFVKDTKVPEGCDINEIRAKFTNGTLHITMPKKVEPAPQVVQQQQEKAEPASTSSTPPRLEATQVPKAETKIPSPNGKKQDGDQGIGEMGATTAYYDQEKDRMSGFGSSLTRFQGNKKFAVGFGVAIATMVAVGAYVAYKYGSLSSSSSPFSYTEGLGIN